MFLLDLVFTPNSLDATIFLKGRTDFDKPTNIPEFKGIPGSFLAINMKMRCRTGIGNGEEKKNS